MILEEEKRRIGKGKENIPSGVYLIPWNGFPQGVFAAFSSETFKVSLMEHLNGQPLDG